MARLATLREEIRQPLPLAYHPLYRSYDGGSLTRRFRGLPDRPDDWWPDLALDMIDYTGVGAAGPSPGRASSRACFAPATVHVRCACPRRRAAVLSRHRPEVADEIEVSDERFSIAIVVSGAGFIEGNFGRRLIRPGETFALPASLPFRAQAGPEPVRVVRCLGPIVE